MIPASGCFGFSKIFVRLDMRHGTWLLVLRCAPSTAAIGAFSALSDEFGVTMATPEHPLPRLARPDPVQLGNQHMLHAYHPGAAALLCWRSDEGLDTDPAIGRFLE